MGYELKHTFFKNNTFLTRKHCPACGSVSVKSIYTREFLNSEIQEYLENLYVFLDSSWKDALKHRHFTLLECSDCSLIFQENVPNEAFSRIIYDQWCPDEVIKPDALYALDMKHQIAICMAYIKRTLKVKALELGIGWGQWCEIAQNLGCQVSGTEISSRRIEKARNNQIRVVDLSECADKEFDFINAKEFFEHIVNPLETLRQCARVLKQGGVIRVSVPDASDIKRRLAKNDWKAPIYTPNSLNAVSPLEHINAFTYRSLVTLAQRAGLSAVNIPVSMYYKTLPSGYPFITLLKRLVKPFYYSLFPTTSLYFTHAFRHPNPTCSCHCTCSSTT